MAAANIGQFIVSLIETWKLKGVEPHEYLTDVITKVVNGHPNSRIDELLPWVYTARATTQRRGLKTALTLWRALRPTKLGTAPLSAKRSSCGSSNGEFPIGWVKSRRDLNWLSNRGAVTLKRKNPGTDSLAMVPSRYNASVSQGWRSPANIPNAASGCSKDRRHESSVGKALLEMILVVLVEALWGHGFAATGGVRATLAVRRKHPGDQASVDRGGGPRRIYLNATHLIGSWADQVSSSSLWVARWCPEPGVVASFSGSARGLAAGNGGLSGFLNYLNVNVAFGWPLGCLR